MVTYYNKDDLKDGTSFVSTSRVAEEGPDEGEDVNGSHPFANIISSIGIVLLQDPCEEQHQVHSNAEECEGSQAMIHCLIRKENEKCRVRCLICEGLYKKCPCGLLEVTFYGN